MALSTYSELQTSIANFLNRSDLTSQIPDFITMAEARFNRELRHWQMETRSTATFDARYEELPADWLETIRISVKGYEPLELVSHDYMLEMREATNDTGGTPSFYALSAGQIELFPTPDDSYDGSMIYFAEIPALSDANTSNWLLENAPDAYLYGALIHSAPYLQEDARVQTWGTLHKSALDSLNYASKTARHSGSGLKVRW